MNIVFYGRYSDTGQSEQSIEGQRKVCFEFAERNGYNIIAEYIDRAISGTEADNRPEFQRMIADSAKRQFQGILVYQLDRFARNRYDSATYKAKLKKNGVKVLSARENITDDASGILMESVLEGMAEYFSVELSQKVTRGMALSAAKFQTTGSVILGYDVDENKNFVINESEAALIKRIFEMYLDGVTMAEIIRYLNDNHYKTSRGNEFTKNSIRRILMNKKYRGVYTFKGTEYPDSIPRIVSDEMFNDAQILLAKNKKAPARSKAVEDEYLLTTKIFCGKCNAAIIGVSGTSHTGTLHQYYKCVTSRRKGGCDIKAVKKAYIEDIVIDETVKLLTPAYIDKLAHAVEKCCEKERNTDTLKHIEKLIRENEKATGNLVKAIEEGKAVDVLSAQIEKRQLEKADLEAQLAKERMQRPVLKYEQIRFFLERFQTGNPADMKYRQSLVDVLIAKIELFDDHMIIYYNTQNGQQMNIPIGDSEGSPMGHLERVNRVRTYPT